MTNIEHNALQVNNLLEIVRSLALPNSSITTAQSETDYGVSGYIHVTDFEREKNFKFRISDHDATNKHRLETEFMLSVYSKAINIENQHLCEAVERYMFPERFRTVRTKQYTGEVKQMTWPANYPLKDYERIVERRIAKSGREVVVVEWDAFFVTETIERI